MEGLKTGVRSAECFRTGTSCNHEWKRRRGKANGHWLGHRTKKWWEVVVTLHSSLPTLFFDTVFTDRQPDHLPIDW